MSKIIIENRSQLNDAYAMELVRKVIIDGRISNNKKQYCYYTRFDLAIGTVGISANLNKCSDRFVLTDIK
ncbi:MAG: hypothetical protein KAT04_14505 [Methylococcales bacterium]|nr:hypothetical protein [Methylococcales bacterium]